MTSAIPLVSIFVLVFAASQAAPQFTNRFSNYQQQNVVRYATDNSGSYGGQYIHDNSGSYYHDDSGNYRHDNSGDYVPDNNPYIHQDGGAGSAYIDSGSYGNSGYRSRSGSFGGTARVGISAIGSGASISGTGFAVTPRPISTTPSSIATRTYATSGFAAQPVLKQGNAAGLYDNRNYAIIRKVEDVGQDGYHYLYETENGILAEEEGHLANKGSADEAMRAQGFYTYTGPDNVVYTVRYSADENGFVPQGDHLPTPPPIPEAIARSLEYLKSVGDL